MECLDHLEITPEAEHPDSEAGGMSICNCREQTWEVLKGELFCVASSLSTIRTQGHSFWVLTPEANSS